MCPWHFSQILSSIERSVQKLFRIPFIFLFIASLMGLLLRYTMIAPVRGINFSHLLHGHSHVMFLGWITNLLLLSFIQVFARDKKLIRIFWVLQIFISGMMISFPLQGYGMFSVTFSALHTFTTFIFIVFFFKNTKDKTSFAILLARYALLFFVLSSVGPFSLGYLKANGLAHSNLYRFAIYFYLHFQYNGFFFFAVLSLFVNLIEIKVHPMELNQIKRACYLLLIAAVPTYFLSILWAKPPVIFNIIGFIASLLQLAGIFLLIAPLKKLFSKNHLFHPRINFLFCISASALLLKLILQTISSFPCVAEVADAFRPIVVAYLHLVLIGLISIFLLGWLLEKTILDKKYFDWILLFLIAFVCSEIILVIMPWYNFRFIHHFLFCFSLLIVLAIVFCLFGLFKENNDSELI
jgi:hypothetical protein